MSTTIPSRLDESGEPGRAGVARQPALRPELAEEVKALLPDELIDELLAGARTEEEIAGRGGLLSQLTKRLVERALEVELPPTRFTPATPTSSGTGTPTRSPTSPTATVKTRAKARRFSRARPTAARHGRLRR